MACVFYRLRSTSLPPPPWAIIFSDRGKKGSRKAPKATGSSLWPPQPSTSQPLPRGSWILLLLPHACLTCLRRYQQKIQKPERILDTCKNILFIGILIVLLDHPRRHPFCGRTWITLCPAQLDLSLCKPFDLFTSPIYSWTCCHYSRWHCSSPGPI